MKFEMFLAASAALLVALPVEAQSTLKFDDVTTSDIGAVPNGYNGLDFSNVDVVDGIAHGYTSTGFGAGYVNGAVSTPYVAFNGFGQLATVSSATPFTLTSAYVTAAFDSGEDATFIGYDGANQLYASTFTVNTSGPVFHSFDWTGITSFTFVGSTRQIVLDNVTINGGTPGAVPEPATWAMMLIGLGMVGYGLRRRERQTVRVIYA